MTPISSQRNWVYPADVTGPYRTRRSQISVFLLAVFLVIPWVTIGGAPFLLFDFWNGRFSVFGIRFWSHDAPMLFFLLGGAAVLLAFVTAIWGRVWCGYACPQTIFVDQVFRRVERFIEGDAVTRRRLDASPPVAAKIRKKIMKWSAFTLIAGILSHSFLAYFIGSEALASMMIQSPSQNPGSFLAMFGITSLVLFDFGWLREQFCVLICPYGRFQSVLMDASSLAVTYDKSRGEPRRTIRSDTSVNATKDAPSGDCVDCGRCVQVCPTGIDIRNGLQLECIACTACIDACDTVMTRLKRPKGLIRYTSSRATARPIVYAAILSIFIGALVWTVSHREAVEIMLIRAVGPPYQRVGNQVVNHFRLELVNQTFAPISIREVKSDLPGIRPVIASLPLVLEAGEMKRTDLFIEIPFTELNEGRRQSRVHFMFSGSEGLEVSPLVKEVSLVGPYR